MDKTIYDRVKEIALRRGLTIAAIENQAKIANGTISGWKASKPYAETLKKVADVLDVSIEDLL